MTHYLTTTFEGPTGNITLNAPIIGIAAVGQRLRSRLPDDLPDGGSRGGVLTRSLRVVSEMSHASRGPEADPKAEAKAAPGSEHTDAAVAPSAASATAGRPGAGGLSPRMMLALQRSAGNAAVQRLIVQRKGGPYAPSRVTVSPAAPTITGSVNWVRKGDSKVEVNGPKIKLEGTASIDTSNEEEWNELGVGDQIQVGPTQTLTSSSRKGAYREGATGPVTAQHNTATGSVRDAYWDREGNKQVASVPAPWYSQPNNINKSTTSSSILFYDYPGFELPLKVGKGTLSAVEGSDNFITSIAAKAGGKLDHIVKFAWSVPWGMQVTPDQRGTGASGVKATPTEAIPPTLDGPIAVEAAATWLSFTTVEQAKAAGAETLLRYLPVASQHDQAAAATIRLALKELDPTINVNVAIGETKDIAFASRYAVVLAGQHTKEFSMLSLDDNESGTASFKLSDLFDIASMAGPLQLTLTVKKYGKFFGHEGEHTFKRIDPPYAGASATEKIGSASVTVTVSL